MFHPRGPTFLELAEQALSSTQCGYDLLAPKFDYTPFRTPDVLLDVVAERLTQRGPFEHGLDICCGTGAGIIMLRPLCRERVVGIDFSRGMLDQCRQNTADCPGSARLEYVEGNALAMPFGDEFDLAVCFGALGHIERKHERRFVSEVARVLRPGGYFAIVTAHRPKFWSRQHWLLRGFNAAMWLRNLVVSPPFVMYYLNFLLPDVERLFRRAGLEVAVESLPPFQQAMLVVGRKPLEPRTGVS